MIFEAKPMLDLGGLHIFGIIWDYTMVIFLIVWRSADLEWANMPVSLDVITCNGWNGRLQHGHGDEMEPNGKYV